jgi:flap endonuclease-1
VSCSFILSLTVHHFAFKDNEGSFGLFGSVASPCQPIMPWPWPTIALGLSVYSPALPHSRSADCRRLLTLMGVPVVTAPCEAEAQAADLAKNGHVYAVGTEDMDALTFATPVLVRKMTFAGSGNKAAVVQSISYSKAIAGLGLTHAQFVDLCILLGCDYCDTIRGVGPKTALKLLREHGSIEGILEKIDRQKYTVPESWCPSSTSEDSDRDEESPPLNDGPDSVFVPAYVQARNLFHNHEVLTDPPAFKWKPCQVPELTHFLVDEMGFDPNRVASSIAKLQAAHKANAKPQSRMDSFFAVKPAASQPKKITPSSAGSKRKTAPTKKAAPTKSAKRR